MRSLDFNVSTTVVTPNFAEIGNAGEHNVTQLNFKISQEILAAVEYYRISIGNFRSQKLYSQNSVVSYILPQSVLQAGTVLLQLDGYKTEGEEVSLIFKSGLISAEVGESVNVSADIPEELKEPLESAVTELKILVENGNEILTEVANNSQSAAESKESASQALEETKLLHKEVKSAEGNIEGMEQSTVLAASMAATSERNAQDYAITAGLESHRAETLANDTEAYAETTRNLCAEASTHAQTAVSSAQQTETNKNSAITAATNAAASALAAAESAERLVTFIDKELPITMKLLEGGAEDWQRCTASDFPYQDGYAIFFKGETKKGLKATCQIEISTEEPLLSVSWGPKVQLSLTNMNDIGDVVDYGSTWLEYNNESGYFEGELTYENTTLEETELCLALRYPVWGLPDSGSYYDTNAVYGSVKIAATENLYGILKYQNDKISAIGKDIESSLDGIISIQETLIGGESE